MKSLTLMIMYDSKEDLELSKLIGKDIEVATVTHPVTFFTIDNIGVFEEEVDGVMVRRAVIHSGGGCFVTQKEYVSVKCEVMEFMESKI